VVEKALSAISNSGEVEMLKERVGDTVSCEAENEMEENEVSSAKLSSSSKSKTFQNNWTLKWPWLENSDDVSVCNRAFHCVDCNCVFHFVYERPTNSVGRALCFYPGGPQGPLL
jgi:hypothetical protein